MANNSDNTTSRDSNSLVAFLGAIKFRKPTRAANDVDQYFAQPQPQARQRRQLAEENYWVRSAN
ncbi:hypothetical protein [Congregibacter litoralis]|uniref:Uncharacterized protein n=1 Tax=Congregibacter litoralis KT71 TaxID=314285 RepID=A4AD04_9GAMM|nr:hypothetical protein [Congregibacter litoralis]EAQ96057.1 hypothetical protein KT71_08375 [Congregibacter litoralis KT71]